mgnify:CR=1 FL=1
MPALVIPRTLQGPLLASASLYPVVTVTGPRQSGKTTLCKATFPDHAYVSLEPLDNREFATSDPRGFLAQYPRGVILDEAQRAPGLFTYLQESVDADPRPGRFIVSGSENLALTSNVSQSLAGRTAMLVLLPFSLEERMRFSGADVGLDAVLFQGGYPRPLVEGIPVDRWLQDYFTTYVQRDVRQLTQINDLSTFTRFVGLCAGRTGQEVNLSQLGSDAGVSHNTARAWLGVLEAAHLVFQLPAWHTNATKRIVKRPKLHLVDAGLACSLLGIRKPEHLRDHPLRGALFETFVASELLKWYLHRGLSADLHHYREVRGAEIDLVRPGVPRGIALEAKAGQTFQPEFVKHLTALDREAWAAYLVYGGATRHTRDGVRIVPWLGLATADWGSEA